MEPGSSRSPTLPITGFELLLADAFRQLSIATDCSRRLITRYVTVTDRVAALIRTPLRCEILMAPDIN